MGPYFEDSKSVVIRDSGHIPPLCAIGDTPAAPSQSYPEHFLMKTLFETSAEEHDWLTRIIAVGTGDRLLQHL